MKKKYNRNSITTKELRALSAYLQNLREEEVEKISQDIHDELGQKLTAVQIELGVLINRVTKGKISHSNKDKLLSALDNISVMVEETIHSTKSLLKRLRPELLEELGLIGAINWYFNDYEPIRKFNCEFVTNAEEKNFSKEVSLAVYRIVQEALTNIVKHSHAKNVLINLRIKKRNFELEIIDDGIGFNVENKKNHKGFGLLGIRERVFSLGGKFQLISEPNEGTKLFIEMAANAEEL